MDIVSVLQTKLPSLSISTHTPLAPLTTFRVGGPAEVLIRTKNAQELNTVLAFLTTNHYPLTTILGNASNVIVSDQGLAGITILHRSPELNYHILTKAPKNQNTKEQKTIDTHRDERQAYKYLDFSSLDYDESHLPQTTVEVESQVPLQAFILAMFAKGLTGLQWFAGIPGTLGGATWYNIHGGNYHLSDFIASVTVFNLASAKTMVLSARDLAFDYDYSVLQKNPKLIILSVCLKLFQGDSIRAKQTYLAWKAQKMKVQPLPSAGSAFKNILTQESATKLGFEGWSTGWVIDHKLGWKGKTVGGAQISSQHANFIVNTGSATASDYKRLTELVQKEFTKRWHLTLPTEVQFLGKYT